MFLLYLVIIRIFCYDVNIYLRRVLMFISWLATSHSDWSVSHSIFSLAGCALCAAMQCTLITSRHSAHLTSVTPALIIRLEFLVCFNAYAVFRLWSSCFAWCWENTATRMVRLRVPMLVWAIGGYGIATGYA